MIHVSQKRDLSRWCWVHHSHEHHTRASPLPRQLALLVVLVLQNGCWKIKSIVKTWCCRCWEVACESRCVTGEAGNNFMSRCLADLHGLGGGPTCPWNRSSFAKCQWMNVILHRTRSCDCSASASSFVSRAPLGSAAFASSHRGLLIACSGC